MVVADSGLDEKAKQPGILSRAFYGAITGHRLLLAVRVISATLDRSGEIKPLPGLTPTA